MRPFISILTPAYNAGKYLPDLIKSITAQSYHQFEHIIIDDGSTDDTPEVLSKFWHSRLRWTSRPNKGQYATQNELLEQAAGDVVVFICADDLLAHTGVLSRVAYGFQDAEVDVLFGRTPRLVSSATPPYTFDPDMAGWMAQRLVRHVLGIQHCSLYVRTALLREHQIGFNPNYRCRGDWDWIIKVFSVAQRVSYVPEPFSLWRCHPGQTSQIAAARGQQESRALCAAYQTSYTVHRILALGNTLMVQAVHSKTLILQIGLRRYVVKLLGFLRRVWARA